MRLESNFCDLKVLAKYSIFRGIVLSLSFWLLGCQFQTIVPQLTTVPLNRVVSGQTVEVTLKGTIERVRIVGIDVPQEVKQAAKAQLQQILSQNIIDLEIITPDRDRYERILAHVWQSDKLVAEELAETGYALANTQYPNKYRDRIWYAQEYARILDYGIWQD